MVDAARPEIDRFTAELRALLGADRFSDTAAALHSTAWPTGKPEPGHRSPRVRRASATAGSRDTTTTTPISGSR